MDLKQLREQLISNIDEKYQEGNLRTVPTAKKNYGVRGPLLVKFAKQLYKENKLELFNELINSDWLEEQMIAVRLLGLEKDSEKAFGLAIGNLNKIHDWCTCDTLATQSLGKYMITNKEEIYDLALKGVEDSNVWVRRFWVAALVPLSLKKNKGDADVAEILSVLDKVMLDEEKYVQKAIHWVLREVTWRDEEKVYSFILKWKGRANKSTLWQGSEKLRKEWREELKK